MTLFTQIPSWVARRANAAANIVAFAETVQTWRRSSSLGFKIEATRWHSERTTHSISQNSRSGSPCETEDRSGMDAVYTWNSNPVTHAKLTIFNQADAHSMCAANEPSSAMEKTAIEQTLYPAKAPKPLVDNCREQILRPPRGGRSSIGRPLRRCQ
ncbi:MAG: hypothetical protein HY043_05230 [Verrucomicrobia bacterium]|nr:hypothetical protein [Verrucomicrobiota bacterium]